MPPIDVLKTLLLYHLMEGLHGNASRIDVTLDPGGVAFSTRDDGRGMGTDRTIAGRRYVDLVLGQLDLFEGDEVLDPAWLQIHGIGMSLAVRACTHFELDIVRNGERSQGSWNTTSRSVVWSDTHPCDHDGTTLRAQPHQGPLEMDDARRLIADLARRCPTLEITSREATLSVGFL